jgi:low temperature requirement protein LtrA
LQKWVSILQISRGTTSIFSPTIAYFCHLFLYKVWLFVIFFHIFFQEFIKQWIDRDSARSFCAATRSYYPVS